MPDLNALFFTKVLGWKKYYPTKKDFRRKQFRHREYINFTCGMDFFWVNKTNQKVSSINENLPKLKTSLDLQEEWLWPELIKKDITIVEFIVLNNGLPRCDLIIDCGGIRVMVSCAACKTKALAQLTAGLKALGVL